MNAFRVLLLDISQQLTTDDLDRLKFACSSFIPAGRAEFITRPHELFLELEKMGKLSESNKEFLALILVQIGRNDLRNKLLNIAEPPLYEERPQYREIPGRQNNQLQPYNQKATPDLILEVAERISTNWKFLGRYLKVPGHTLNNIDDTYRKTEEKGYKMLEKWLETSETPTLLVLIRGLNSCGRRDLAEIVEAKIGGSSTQPTENADGQFAHMQDLRDALPDMPGERHHRQPAEGAYAESETDARPAVQESDQDNLKSFKPGSLKDEKRYVGAELLGVGGFSKVYCVMDKETKIFYAVKTVDLGENDKITQEKVDALEKEVKLLRILDNPYVVKYFKTETYPHSLALFMEYMPGGSVAQKLVKVKSFDQETVRKYTWQLLKGLEYLHENKVIHRDIKGANILLDQSNERVKLSDFGISVSMEGIATSTGNCMSNKYGVFASVFWTSPELLCSEPYSYNTDIWSLGCVVVEMLTGNPPYRRPDVVMVQVMYKISTCVVEIPDECSSMAKEFLDHCFLKRSQRSSAKNLLETNDFPYPQQEQS